MILFEKFRAKIAIKRLIRTEKRRTTPVKVCRPLVAKSIGLLAAPESEENYNELLKTVQTWQAKGKEVMLVVWFNSHKVPDWASVIAPGVITFSRRNTGFFFTPASDEVTEFVNRPFQVLLNLDANNSLPLLYIAVTSASAFRAGFSFGDIYLHDFTLMPDVTPGEKQNYETLIHTLNQINHS